MKSIVPSWLQKYFKNDEVAEGEESHVQVEQNSVPTPPNGSQESAPLPDGRNSPEPSTSNPGTVLHSRVLKMLWYLQGHCVVFLPDPFYAISRLRPEPSTSRASLNFQDVLSRPPLNRSHLHFPSHDGSPALGGSLFSQPSTSTAPFPASPFAVSSSFSLVKEIKDSSSQHEDDNISTTSGFSSRASDKGKAELQESQQTHTQLAPFLIM